MTFIIFLQKWYNLKKKGQRLLEKHCCRYESYEVGLDIILLRQFYSTLTLKAIIVLGKVSYIIISITLLSIVNNVMLIIIVIRSRNSSWLSWKIFTGYYCYILEINTVYIYIYTFLFIYIYFYLPVSFKYYLIRNNKRSH